MEKDKFKIGDTVECIDNEGGCQDKLIVGKRYTVLKKEIGNVSEGRGPHGIYLKIEDEDSPYSEAQFFYSDRFKLYEGDEKDEEIEETNNNDIKEIIKIFQLETI